MTLQTLVQPVGELMRKVAADVVLPYFRQLSAGDIEEKSPGDPVTIADRESEAQLAVGLSRLMPGIRCLLYTSDAADERSSVDLGGRRLIKKK